MKFQGNSLPRSKIDMGGGGGSNMLQQMMMLQALQPKAAMTAQAAPGGVTKSSTDALGVQRFFPQANIPEAGMGATGEAAKSFITQGSNAQRLISEAKNMVSNYKNVLGERKSMGKDPYDPQVQIPQDFLQDHDYLRRLSSEGMPTSTLPAYQASQDAIGGASAAMFVQGNKNPNYAKGLGVELTPSVTSTRPEEDVNKIKILAMTPLATEYAMAHGLINANELAKIQDFKQLQPLVDKAMKNGFNPNAPEVVSQIKDILKTAPSDERYANMKFSGFDYHPQLKQQVAQGIQNDPVNRDKYLTTYKEQTGEEYNG